MGTKTYNNYEDLLTFTRASKGHALRPVSYGTELVTNTWVDNSAGSSSISESSGELTLTCVGGDVAWAYEQIDLKAGSLYVVSYEVKQDVGGNVHIYIGETTAGSQSYSKLASVGSYTDSFIASANTSYISLREFTAGTAIVDNISVKEVTFDKSDGTLTLFEHPNNIPRVEWDAQRNRLGLLVEEARTNLFHYSNDFSNSYWGKSELTATAEQGIAPDGTNTAFKIIESSTANIARHVTRGGGTLANSTQYTAAVYLKKGTRTKAKINVFTGTASHTGKYDIENGTVYSSAGADAATIEDVGNGWFRCSITTTTSASGNPNVAFGPLPDSYDVIYDGDGSSYIYAWGAQLEQASFPTSYIKTTGATATRSADTPTINTSEFGFNAKNFTVFCEWDTIIPAPVAWPTFTKIFTLQEANGTENAAIVGSSGNAAVYGSVYTEGAHQVTYSAFQTDGNPEKTAFRLGTDTFLMANDGTLLTEDTSVNMPTLLNRMGIGLNGGNLTQHLNGHVKSIKFYPRRLTNAQLQDLTS
jgi:hypothetical protein